MRSFFSTVHWGLWIGLMLVAGTVQAQPESTAAAPRAWIFLAERPPAVSPSEEATAEARRRRQRRGTVSAAALTRPVAPSYLRMLRAHGVQPVVRSRWLHAISATLTSQQRTRIATLPFVTEIRPVARGTAVHYIRRTETAPASSLRPWAPPSRPPAVDSSHYGPSYAQLAVMNALRPLERGLTGRGVRIGFMDTGFRNLQHPAFLPLRQDQRLLGLRDFTVGTQTNNHGAGVASAAVGYAPGSLVGPAHGAEVLGASTEFTRFERNVEEDYFVAGLEWLERQGVDLVNVSLGYTTFDEGERSYTTADLDGDTGVTTRAVDAAAQLGVTVVVSAGNSGCGDPANCWFRVSTPADADSVITVGAVGPDSTVLPFSSRGPTADGRVKPDVAALGRGVTAAWESDQYAQVSGTSFAAPLVTGVVAQMLEVNPSLTPMDVRSLLRRTASQAHAPDTTLGWGIVNADAAVRAAERRARQAPPTTTLLQPPSPNPARTRTTFVLRAPSDAEQATITVYDVLGRRALKRRFPLQPGPNRLTLPLDVLSAGLYVYRIRTADHLSTGKLVVMR